MSSGKYVFSEKVALIADRNTATFYRLAGLKNVFPVENPAEAETYIRKLSENSSLLIILITDPIVDKLQNVLEQMVDLDRQLFIPIPDVANRGVTKTDLMKKFIKRKTGIEFKL